MTRSTQVSLGKGAKAALAEMARPYSVHAMYENEVISDNVNQNFVTARKQLKLEAKGDKPSDPVTHTFVFDANRGEIVHRYVAK